MSRVPRLSLRRGPKVKPQPETERSYESGCSSVSGAHVLSPVHGASETSLDKAERKREKKRVPKAAEKSSTLVSSQHAAGPQHTATPGASGANAHGSPSFPLEPYEPEPRSVLSSSYDAGRFEGERQCYQNTIDDLEQNLEKEKEVSKKARDDLERELRRKDDELRALQWKKEHELEEALQERDRTTQEELQKKEKELKQNEEELQVAMQAKTEKWRDMLREQMEMKQGEVNGKQKETERLQARLREKESAAAGIVSKQEGEVQKLQTELELKYKEHEIALKKQRSQLQAVMVQKERDRKKSESEGREAVQTRESALQKVREELKQKTEEFEAEKEVQQSWRQASFQSEQQLRDVRSQLEKQKQEHTREMDLKLEEQQVLIRKMETDHQTELETLHQHKDQALQEALQQRGRETSERVAELKAAQDRHAQELKEKDARIRQLEAERQKREREISDKDRALQEKVQQRGGESAGELKTQHAQELKRKDAQIQQLESEGRMRHREVMDESKKEQELQIKIQEMEKQHREALEEKNRQVQRAIDEMHKSQENALTMQKARIERKVEKEQERKLQETLDRARTELEQAAADKAKAELQQKETEFQAVFAKSKEELQQKEMEFQAAIQRRDREFEDRMVELRSRHVQELVGKDAKIYQLQEEAAQFIPSSEPPDEAHMDDLPSNVIDLAREISHFVDPENIIPQGKLTREISPDEFHHVMQAFGSPVMLGAQKPQSFLFAVLPANNKMRSTLFDYTGCFGEIEEEQPGSLPYRTPDGGSPELSVHEAPRSLGEPGCYHGMYIQEKQSCERAERECIELRVANEELGINLSDVELEVDGLKRQALSWKEFVVDQGSSVATLKDKMEKLVRENHELEEVIEIRQREIEFAKRDFEAERHDREQAAKHYHEEKAKVNYENQQLTSQLMDHLRDIEMYKSEIDKSTVQLGEQKAKLGVYQQQAMQYRQQQQLLRDNCVSLQQQLQRQAEVATQQLQLLQQRLDAALAEVQHLRHSPQIAPQSHKPWNIPRQEVEIMIEIGRGAWGAVYKGKYQGQSVAVKCVHPEILTEHTIERLRREVHIMARVRHPNLLRFIGAVLDSQVSHLHPPLIVLELLDMNLRMAYQTKRLQGPSKIPIFRDIAYALHYLHEHHEPIIHRDVSAPNVLLEALPNGMWRAKVSDFGSANLAKLAQTMAEGAIIYAAPETIPHELSSRPPPQTTKIDVFSYGVLLCEVITSQMPDRDRFWIMLQQVEKQWTFMHKLILSCIKQNADERPTMAEILDRLNTLPRPN